MNYSKQFFEKSLLISKNIDHRKVEKLVKILLKIRKDKGRIFCIGVGGSAANSSHLVNDLRKLCKIESYSATDNVSELSARINDDGWNNSIHDWLEVSNLNNKDALFVLSVGGGNEKKNVSVNIVNAVKIGIKKKAKILGIIGKEDGYTALKGDCIITVPIVDDKLITPMTESFQALIWHSIVSNPLIQVNKTKW